MSKYNRLMLFITLFSLVFQVPAGVFEFCSQTSRENSRLESQKDITELTEDCHQADADKDNSTETCDAQHLRPGSWYCSRNAIASTTKAGNTGTIMSKKASASVQSCSFLPYITWA